MKAATSLTTAHSSSTTSPPPPLHASLISSSPSHLAPGPFPRSLATLLQSTQLPSLPNTQPEASRIHQSRIEAVRLLREGVVEGGGLGLVLLGFDMTGVSNGDAGGRLELSDRRFALDALIELVQKPRSVTHSKHTAGTRGRREFDDDF